MHLFFLIEIHSKIHLLIFLEINLISSEEDNNEEKTNKVDKNKENESITCVTDEDNKGENEMSKSNENISVEENKTKESGVEKGNTENEINEDVTGNIMDNEIKPPKQEENNEASLLDRRGRWWKPMVDPELLEDINQSAKLILLFTVLRECEMIEDKV